MKIDNINLIKLGTATRAAAGAADGSFSDMLDQALSSMHHSSQAILPSAPAPISMPLFINHPPKDDVLHRQAMDRAQKLLSSLDSYQSLLGQDNVSLKQVGAGLDQLEEQIRQTAPMLDKLEAGDPLQDILQSISSLALVEAIKFRRGDYS